MAGSSRRGGGVSVGQASAELPAAAAGAVAGDIFPVPGLSPGVLQHGSPRRERHRPLLALATLQHNPPPPAFLGISYLLVAKRTGSRGRG